MLTPTPATTIDHRLHVLAGAVPGPVRLRRHRSHVRHTATQLLLPAQVSEAMCCFVLICTVLV